MLIGTLKERWNCFISRCLYFQYLRKSMLLDYFKLWMWNYGVIDSSDPCWLWALTKGIKLPPRQTPLRCTRHRPISSADHCWRLLAPCEGKNSLSTSPLGPFRQELPFICHPFQTLLRPCMWFRTTQRPSVPCAHPPDFLFSLDRHVSTPPPPGQGSDPHRQGRWALHDFTQQFSPPAVC